MVLVKGGRDGALTVVLQIRQKDDNHRGQIPAVWTFQEKNIFISL